MSRMTGFIRKYPNSTSRRCPDNGRSGFGSRFPTKPLDLPGYLWRAGLQISTMMILQSIRSSLNDNGRFPVNIIGRKFVIMIRVTSATTRLEKISELHRTRIKTKTRALWAGTSPPRRLASLCATEVTS